MLGIELLELAGKVRELRSGSQTVEVRQGSAKRLYDTIPSFANRQGGHYLRISGSCAGFCQRADAAVSLFLESRRLLRLSHFENFRRI